MFIIIPIVFEVLFFVVFVRIVFTIIKNAKSMKNTLSKPDEENMPFQNTVSNANDPDSYGNSLSSEPVETYCDYCGSKFNRMKKRCPSCGARIQKKD